MAKSTYSAEDRKRVHVELRKLLLKLKMMRDTNKVTSQLVRNHFPTFRKLSLHIHPDKTHDDGLLFRYMTNSYSDAARFPMAGNGAPPSPNRAAANRAAANRAAANADAAKKRKKDDELNERVWKSARSAAEASVRGELNAKDAFFAQWESVRSANNLRTHYRNEFILAKRRAQAKARKQPGRRAELDRLAAARRAKEDAGW